MVEYRLMLSPRLAKTAVTFASSLLVTACATHGTGPVRTASTPPQRAVVPVPAPAPPPSAQPDPVVELIAVSSRHFEAGQHQLQLGHLEGARTEFNRSLEVLLESPFGGRTEPRIREHFDRLIERISAYEVTALAQADGFEEQRTDSATIDELFAVSTFEPPAPSAETTEAVTADLQSIVHDIEIPLNARVLAFVQLFSGRLKSFLEEGLSRGVQYLPMIQRIFRAEGLPMDLAYVPLVESAFKPSAVSRAKARGIWQFMRGTALENGLRHDWYIDERAEPEKSTRAAAAYLKSLRDMFDGDWHLALASYNGGPGRVQRAMKRSGRRDFWKLASPSSRLLPRETRDYVPLILAAIIIARNPAQYGLEIEPMEPLRSETVTLSSAIDLRRVAEWVGMPVEAIRNLNPELRRWTTPVRAADYELKVPAGTGDIVRAHLAATDPADLAPFNWHTVKKGETLLSIGRKLGVSRADLADANYLSARAKLAIGQRLIIPRAPSLVLASRTDTPPPALETEPAAEVLAATNTAPGATATTPASVTYRVKRGDTLFAIAKLYRTTVASLKTWNRLRSNSIQVGQRLTIFTRTTAAATS